MGRVWRQHALIAVIAQGDGGLLDAQPLDEAGHRLAGDRAEDAMEVEGREGGHPRQGGFLSVSAVRHRPERTTNFGAWRLSHYTRDIDE
jgi:hypothetical protein